MANTQNKKNRREQILQALAHMLETSPGQRITTAKLAAAVGVSEAALYRHFPSKARMFEGLIDFIEETLFSRINLILQDEKDSALRLRYILQLVLGFCERNPGITRLLNGDALQGEHERLLARINQLFDRLETQLKQVMRERRLYEGEGFAENETVLANLLLAYAEGRINQYVRSQFRIKPTHNFDSHWQLLHRQLAVAA
ncbi:nucleoid occlusion factor SlmA [Zobellella denitrificans]|jgi:TetR/AcrR family transcriptional regulator|uniref:Nucleoid occlusion factor SlmA n=2 Tax=Zobellella TaxID=347533 RepID=A0A231MW56_9GAMM|nr:MULTISPECIES: nucleoid occlusion factor SlmA [Zobellella]ATG72543.1 TetR family transcriptional regulator [Zobellella denitrificans]MBL1376145.1 nucleoid occlusion factor SlmA [Zobellella iuensis]OXS14310.1 nucleoid occlusion factor SlmA [Zobellella denitrificans]